MSKNKQSSYIALGIAFILFNVLAFVIPTDKETSFWIAYAFSDIAFVSQIGIWHFALKNSKTLKSKFLGIPIIYVGSVYLIIQLIAFALFMAYPATPSWVAVVVCTLIISISAISLIGADVARDEIDRVEEKIQDKVFFIKSLQVDVELLVEREQDEFIKKELIELSRKIRFSDPMSNGLLLQLETSIAEKIVELKTVEDKAGLINEISFLLEERNKKIKLLK